MNNQKTALYRHYNSDSQLLYVGISLSAASRFIQHKQMSLWADDAVRMETEYFYNRKDALSAEKLAIKTEKPLNNIIHNTVKVVSKKKQSCRVGKEEDNYPFFNVSCGVEDTGEVFVCMTKEICEAMLIDGKRTLALIGHSLASFQSKLLTDKGFKNTLTRV